MQLVLHQNGKDMETAPQTSADNSDILRQKQRRIIRNAIIAFVIFFGIIGFASYWLSVSTPDVNINLLNITFQYTNAHGYTNISNAILPAGYQFHDRHSYNIRITFYPVDNKSCSVTIENISSLTRGFTIAANPMPVTLGPHPISANGTSVVIVTLTVTTPPHPYYGQLGMYVEEKGDC